MRGLKLVKEWKSYVIKGFLGKCLMGKKICCLIELKDLYNEIF